MKLAGFIVVCIWICLWLIATVFAIWNRRAWTDLIAIACFIGIIGFTLEAIQPLLGAVLLTLIPIGGLLNEYEKYIRNRLKQRGNANSSDHQTKDSI
jgi:hypothetical protein